MTKSIATFSPRDTNPVSADHARGNTVRDTLYRFVSTLDADVHITVAATDDVDGRSFAESEALPVGGDSTDPDGDTKLVTNGATTTQVESTLLTEGWPWLRLTVTAQTIPTAGSVEVRVIEDF